MNAKYIKNWEELSKETSDTHVLEINPKDCCGWVHPKIDLDFNGWEGHHYLSTHTFYGGFNDKYTEILQQCGFNVILANWDEEDK